MLLKCNDKKDVAEDDDIDQPYTQDDIEGISENLQGTFISAENEGTGNGLTSVSDDDSPVAPISERIVEHLATSEAVLKSQQRNEPDLTFQERKVIAAQILKEKPGQFLYRFGKYLQCEHLVHFLQFEGDPEVDFYLAETAKQINPHTSKVAIRNRRYAALQKMRSSGDYFSESEMENREPLLYEQLIGRHLTDDERSQLHANTTTSDDQGFSAMLFHHIDFRDERLRREREQDYEDGMFEEEEDDEDEDEKELRSDTEQEDMAEESEKRILREEFYSTVYNDFLGGKDKEFDYKNIDSSEAYDLLEIRARDEEERYFDEDDDEQNLTTDSNNQAVADIMES